jgi:drug/metabolite transporter (DMT)-like permease
MLRRISAKVWGNLMDVLFGLASAIGWGTTYFITRIPARIIGTLRTVLYFQIVGLLMLGVVLLITGEWRGFLALSSTVWLWLFISAMGNTFSVISDFKAIQIGVLSVVTPITANYAVVTLIFALLYGETLTPNQWVGIILATLGILLVTARRYNLKGNDDRQLITGIVWALAAALGYGFSYWTVGVFVAPAMGGFLPVVAMRINSIIWLTLFIIARRRKVPAHQQKGRIALAIIAMAFMDNIATVASFVGYATTNVSIVTIVASMYTVVTILLARIFYGEKLIPQQRIGVLAIVSAIILVSL